MQPGMAPAVGLLPARRVIATAWDLVTSRPKEVLLPVAAVEVPVSVVAALVIAGALSTVLRDVALDGQDRGYLALLLIVGAGQALFAQVAHGAAIVSIAAVLRGKPVPLAGALDPAFTRMGGLLALLVILVAMSVLLALTIIGLVLLPYLVVRLALAHQAFMLEGRSPFAALGRSWALMRGHMLRMLGVMLLTFLIFLGPAILISALDGLVAGSRGVQVALQALVSVVQGVLAVPLVAFASATTTVFYLNLEDAARG
ncbi:hypothetical protein A9A59_2210 [Tepidiforma thermophila]|uniref:Glycerophosphoryl diester phosphodiesterase membrane domain-containing protein n=2 Tax=Tepidiforma thermophila (strain KCTC 52669 / CGMCC 1.13589 / G233) TaxID=2761530 RepID=A0A2A9HG02_TEPT2|nr:hypothetical protein A9A59_2210 [Tepidiforma thermophila]